MQINEVLGGQPPRWPRRPEYLATDDAGSPSSDG